MKNRISAAVLVLLALIGFAPYHASTQEVSAANRKVAVKVAPEYPALARSMNIQGIVRADVLVAPNGKVTSVEVKGGHPLLAKAAQDALRQWKWEAASHETHETVELHFNP
ncbi:MAG: energy transducer TonB [Candidatus Sulfotelmatobacter sp.]